MRLPPLSVYIHLPWCERKCPYCDFNSHEKSHVPEADYVQALVEDLQEDLPLVAGREIVSVFIGGGTPSLFSVAAVERLLDQLRATLPLAHNCEITMEANPGSSETEKFAGFQACGVNRLSLGVQSFSDSHLQSLGRVHSAAQAHKAIEQLMDAGFQNFNIDLMHGLPGQTPQEARDDVSQALSYNPPHLSWYQLTIEPNTAFYSAPPKLPEEDSLAMITDTGEALLNDAGMQNYEVSAYQLPRQYSRHNHNYWTFGDYLGLGAGAHAKITRNDGIIERFSRLKQPEAYLAALPQARRCHHRALSTEDRIGEFMLNALRLTAGFSKPTFSARTGIAFSMIAERVESLIHRGLLELDGENLRTTATGRRFLDSVVGEFF